MMRFAGLLVAVLGLWACSETATPTDRGDPAVSGSASAVDSEPGEEAAQSDPDTATRLHGVWGQTDIRYIPINGDMELAIATSTVTLNADSRFDYDGVLVFVPRPGEKVSMRARASGNWHLEDGKFVASLDTASFTPDDNNAAKQQLADSLEQSFLKAERTNLSLEWDGADRFKFDGGESGLFGEEYSRSRSD